MEGLEGPDTAGALTLPGAAPERRASAFSASEGTSDVSSSDPSRVYQGFMDFIHPNLSQSMFNHPQNFFTSIALASGFDICFALGKRKGAALLPDAAFGWVVEILPQVHGTWGQRRHPKLNQKTKNLPRKPGKVQSFLIQDHGAHRVGHILYSDIGSTPKPSKVRAKCSLKPSRHGAHLLQNHWFYLVLEKHGLS